MSSSTKSKFSFIKDVEEIRHLEPINLNVITTVGSFQSLNQNDEIKSSRNDEIEKYCDKVADFISAKVGGTNSKLYDGKEIDRIYFLIFNQKGPSKKNDKIDLIVDFYKKYVRRNNNNTGNTIINLQTTKSKLEAIDTPFIKTLDDELEEEDDDEAEF